MNQKKTSSYEELLKTIAYTWLTLRQKGKKMLADQDFDLTFEQVTILQILKEEEGLQLGVLAGKADRESTTISRMVDGLEKRNLAIRIPDKYDKRQKLIYLTNLGKKRNEEMIPLLDRFLKDMFRGVNLRQTESALEILRKIFDNLNEN